MGLVGLDVGIVGCVPLTGALHTLPAADDHGENLHGPHSVISRLAGLRAAFPKPWVAVVDAGSAYDAAATLLAERGVPTFRTADRALEIVGRYCRSHLGLATG